MLVFLVFRTAVNSVFRPMEFWELSGGRVHGRFLACLHRVGAKRFRCEEVWFLPAAENQIVRNVTEKRFIALSRLVLRVFTVLRTAVNSDFFIRRWHALQQHVCVRWCHHLCQAPRFVRFYVDRTETCRTILYCVHRYLLKSAITVCLMGHTAVQTSVAQRICFFLKSPRTGVRRAAQPQLLYRQRHRHKRLRDQ